MTCWCERCMCRTSPEQPVSRQPHKTRHSECRSIHAPNASSTCSPCRRHRAPLTTEARREGFAKLMAMGAKSPAIARSEDIFIPGPGGPLRLRLSDPISDRQGDAPALVFFHGGGLVAGSIETHDAICRSIAIAMNGIVVSVGYRRAPRISLSGGAGGCGLRSELDRRTRR